MLSEIGKAIFDYRGTLLFTIVVGLASYSLLVHKWITDPAEWFETQAITETPQKPTQPVEAFGTIADPLPRQTPLVALRGRVTGIEKVTIADTGVHIVARVVSNDDQKYRVILPRTMGTVAVAKMQFPEGHYLVFWLIWWRQVEGIDFFKWSGGDYIPQQELNG